MCDNSSLLESRGRLTQLRRIISNHIHRNLYSYKFIIKISESTGMSTIDVHNAITNPRLGMYTLRTWNTIDAINSSNDSR